MRYIRTKGGKIYKTLEDYMQSDLPPTKIRVENVAKDWHIIIPKSKIVKQADTIEDLIMAGDLVKYYDQTTKAYDYAEITDLFNPAHTIIYRVVELYIKQPNGDFKLVAKDVNNSWKLQIV